MHEPSVRFNMNHMNQFQGYSLARVYARKTLKLVHEGSLVHEAFYGARPASSRLAGVAGVER